MLAWPGRARFGCLFLEAPKWATGTSPDAHFGAWVGLFVDRANTGRPVGPKTSDNHNTINFSRAKYIVPVSDADYRRGRDLFRVRPDKSWSMVDCISMCIMEREKLQEALTSYRHFEQAGFTILLK